MKKKLYITTLIISVLAILFTMAAGPTPESKFAELVAMRFIYHKGYVFVFALSGKFRKAEMIGSVKVAGEEIPLHCILKGDKKAVCTAVGLKRHVGKSAWVALGIFGRFVTIPEPRINNNQPVCYAVYDWNITGTAWEPFEEYCQGLEPENGDAITMYNPTWGGTYTYVYQDSVPCDDQGNGYYYGVTFDNYYAILCP